MPRSGYTERNQVICPAVVILHADAVIHGIGNQPAQLCFISAGMRAVCHNNGKIFCRKTAVTKQVVNQMRYYPVLPHPEAGHVADNKRYFIPRFHAATERFMPDRVIQAAAYSSADIRKCRNIIPGQLCLHLVFIQRDCDTAAAVCKSIIFHVLSPEQFRNQKG